MVCIVEIFKVQSAAKINLRLKIVERFPDGFHALDMLNCRLSLADEIVLKIREMDQSRPHKFYLTKLAFSKDLQSFELDSLDNSLVASANIFESYYPINNYIDFNRCFYNYGIFLMMLLTFNRKPSLLRRLIFINTIQG